MGVMVMVTVAVGVVVLVSEMEPPWVLVLVISTWWRFSTFSLNTAAALQVRA
jgi:hypothetical protein